MGTVDGNAVSSATIQINSGVPAITDSGRIAASTADSPDDSAITDSNYAAGVEGDNTVTAITLTTVIVNPTISANRPNRGSSIHADTTAATR